MEKRCFNIKINDDSFKAFLEHNSEFPETLHCHLSFPDNNQIELKILYSPVEYSIYKKFLNWLSKQNRKNLGNKIEVISISYPEDIKIINFSGSSNVGFRSGHRKEGEFEYVSLFFDKVQIHEINDTHKKNQASFYLNKNCFDIVAEFYAPMFHIGNKFEYMRMNDSLNFYTFNGLRFRPEFDFYLSENDKYKDSTIVKKEPKFEVKFNKSKKLESILTTVDLIFLYTSFYFNSQVEHFSASIYFEHEIVRIYKIQRNSAFELNFHFLYGVNYNKRFNDFLQEQFIIPTEIVKLNKVIEQSIHSTMVEGSSRFLILFSIIEILKGSDNGIKFTSLVDKKNKKRIYNEAFEKLITTVGEKEEFELVWNAFIKNSGFKLSPLKGKLETFFKNQNIENVPIDELILIRNKITHGSIENIDNKEIDSCNLVLHKITNALILNMIGINSWSIN